MARLRHALRADDDALAAFRDRIATRLSAMSVALLLPFVVAHAWTGRTEIVAIILVAQAVLVLDAWALRRGRPPPVPFWAMSLTLIVVVCGSVLLQGMNGVFWAYPTLFICYFVLVRRVAQALSLVLLVAVTAVAAVALPSGIAPRVFATLGFTLVMINVVLNVIGDLQRALVAQAITDPLTGAFNRRHLQAQLAQLAVAGHEPRTSNALLAIDIDHFKQINDRLGHDAGDAVLRRLVTTVSARKRRSDMLFRTGGEEFVLLLPATSADDALRVAEELRRRVELAPLIPGTPVTVSIGVGLQRSGQGPDAWLKDADCALYDAKRGGRNRVVLAPAA